MKPSLKPTRLDLTAGTTLFFLSLLIAGLVSYSRWAGLSVSLHTANPTDAISPFETINLRFSQPVRANDFENQLQIQPATAGKIEWPDDQTAVFIPSQPFQGIATVRLAPGPLGADETWLRQELAWQLTVRQPEIAYINYSEPQGEVMAVPLEGGTPRQVTTTGGRVFQFGVAHSGDMVAYSAWNDQKGIDLWLIQRDGSDPRKVLDCGFGRCTNPTWSAGGYWLAYTLEAAGIAPGEPPGAPRPWVLDLSTGENRPVFSDRQTIGYGISWSPDGNWLASYDGINDLIRVVNLTSGQQVTLPSNSGTSGAWSPDSRYLLYTSVVSGDNNLPVTLLYRADFLAGETGIFLGQASDEADYAYRNPAWSPDGSHIALGMRADPANPSRQIWIISPDVLEGPVIAQEPNYIYDSFQWDLWGINLVFEQFDRTEPYNPQIAIWNSTQGVQVLVDNAVFPAWLP